MEDQTILIKCTNLLLEIFKGSDMHVLTNTIDFVKTITNKKVLLYLINNGGASAMCFASRELQNDKEVVLKAVEELGETLEFASSELQNDREIVLKAVMQDGCNLEFASKKLQNHKEIALEAIKNTEFALEYVSRKLKNDQEFMSEAIKINKNVLKYMDKYDSESDTEEINSKL